MERKPPETKKHRSITGLVPRECNPCMPADCSPHYFVLFLIESGTFILLCLLPRAEKCRDRSLSPFLLSPREHSRSRFEAFSLATTALVRTFSSVLIVGVESRERAVWFACRPAARCSAVPSVFCGPRGRNKIPLRIPLEVLLTPETVGFQGISDKSTSLPRLKGFA